MKKREVIKQKNKLKQMPNMKYLSLAKYACIFLILVFLVYIGILSVMLNKPFEELLSKDPIVIVGFMICTANLYIWYVLKHFINDIRQLENIESIRINLIVMTIGQVLLLNYISALLMILSLWKYFRWNNFSLKKALSEIKRDKQMAVLIVTSLVLCMFIALVFGIFFATR